MPSFKLKEMKYIVYITAIALFLFTSCKQGKETKFPEAQDMEAAYEYDYLPDSLKSVIKFEQTSHDFGSFRQDMVKKVTFAFTNTGKSPLILHEVSSSCGCAHAEYDKAPILPTQKGTVTITFDGRMYDKGKFNKNVIISSNAVNRYVELTIKGETK